MQKTPDAKKLILSDPITAYRNTYADPEQAQIRTLEKLQAEYTQCMQKHREAKAKVKSLSGEIGRAKSEHSPLEPLLAAMKAHSKALRECAEDLSRIEQRILDFFNAGNTPDGRADARQSNTHAGHQRIYALAGAPDSIHVALLDDSHDEWNRYVTCNPAATIYHLADWKDLIKRSFGHDGYYFQARDGNGRIVGILPLIRLNSRLFGDFMVSMPFFNYGGAVGDHPLVEERLMQVANEHAASIGVSHIEYRDDIPREELPASTKKANMLLELPDNAQTLWEGFTPKLRAQIRRPRRENPRIRHGGEELLNDFHAVFARNMRDLGTPVYGKSFFRNILQTFPEQSRILTVSLDQGPVAAGFLIGYRDMLEIPWASSLRQFNHLSMNMLLYWSALEFAIDRQYRYFDFGRSSRGAGTYRFKQQWGARPRQLYWHYWLQTGTEPPALNPDNPKYALAIKLWRHMPLTVTKWLGPSIVRYLP